MRAGTSMLFDVRQGFLGSAEDFQQTCARQDAGVEMDLRASGCQASDREYPASARDSCCNRSIRACTRKRKLRSRSSGPYSTADTCPLPAGKQPDLSGALGGCAGVRGQWTWDASPGFESFRRAARDAKIANCGILSFSCASASLNGHSVKMHGITRLELAHFPQLGLNDGGRADKTA